MTVKSNFLDIIKKQRKKSKKKKFSGTFLDYLTEIEDNPEIIKLAHKRLNDAITSYGVKSMGEESERCNKLFDSESVRVYEYFQSHFFGMERVIAKVMSAIGN